MDQKFSNSQKPLRYFVGNKCDLDELREVEQSSVDQMVKEQNGTYYEVSALTGKNVIQLFEDITNQYDKVYEKSTPKSPKPMLRDEPKKSSCCFE